jgi:hypothetical protein
MTEPVQLLDDLCERLPLPPEFDDLRNDLGVDGQQVLRDDGARGCGSLFLAVRAAVGAERQGVQSVS